MSRTAVKSIRDLIIWRYAKIISQLEGFGKKNHGFIMAKFKKLQNREIESSSSIREWLKENEKKGECIYCGAKKELSVEHILPKSRGGSDTSDNLIMTCMKCNYSK